MPRQGIVDHTPAQVAWKVQQGADWALGPMTIKLDGVNPSNLTGCTFAAVARDIEGSSGPAVVTFDVVTAQLASGIISITAADTVTAAVDPGRYWWELAMTDAATLKRTLINGPLEVKARTAP